MLNETFSVIFKYRVYILMIYECERVNDMSDYQRVTSHLTLLLSSDDAINAQSSSIIWKNQYHFLARWRTLQLLPIELP